MEKRCWMRAESGRVAKAHLNGGLGSVHVIQMDVPRLGRTLQGSRAVFLDAPGL